jgi:aminoglycoside N3'-acetyltransferase
MDRCFLLGVGHDSNTTVHLGESLADVRYRRKKHVTILKEGKPGRFDYREIDHCCQTSTWWIGGLMREACNARDGSVMRRQDLRPRETSSSW